MEYAPEEHILHLNPSSVFLLSDHREVTSFLLHTLPPWIYSVSLQAQTNRQNLPYTDKLETMNSHSPSSCFSWISYLFFFNRNKILAHTYSLDITDAFPKVQKLTSASLQFTAHTTMPLNLLCQCLLQGKTSLLRCSEYSLERKALLLP